MIEKPAKELAILLQTKIMLERVNTEPGMKSDGSNIKQFCLLANKQNEFAINYGAVVENLDFSLTQTEAFKNLTNAIQKHGDRIKFHALTMPARAGLEHCVMDLNSDVIMRIIEYYEIRTDEILTRYDILIEKIIR